MAKEVLIPDVGEAEDIEVIEILVAVGDTVNADDSLIVLESDKASMEIPAPFAGKVESITVKVGDQVDEGDLILTMESAEQSQGDSEAPSDSGDGDKESQSDEGESGNDQEAGKDEKDEKGESGKAPDADEADKDGNADDSGEDNGDKPDTADKDKADKTDDTVEDDASTGGEETEVTVPVPDVGDAEDVEVVEILVAVGDAVKADDSLVVLESDKASMEIPSPGDGVVSEILVSEGDTVVEGDALLKFKTASAPVAKPTTAVEKEKKSAASADKEKKETETPPERAAQRSADAGSDKEKSGDRRDAEIEPSEIEPSAKVHAGPAVRKQAREYGVDLAKVSGSGPNDRILKEDVQEYVKAQLSGDGPGSGIPAMPEIDFTRFGKIDAQPLSRVRRASARNVHRSWLNVPHVTQFDEADVTELENFRKAQNAELADSGIKLTPLAFLLKACANALIKYPRFNASLDVQNEHLIVKQYCNIGIAVETDDGLMVPVLKDADKKGIVELAQASAALAQQARQKKLALDAMQGATFTISSLGGIGGTAFTPIVNAPEVAILGVSRSKTVPMWDGKEFRPRTMMPLSLSYDHRAIDGAEAVRFTNYLSKILSDVRRMLM